MSIALFQLVSEIQASDPLLVGVVGQVFADATASVDLPGGGRMRVRNPLALSVGAHVYLQGGAITGGAPALEVIEVLV